MEKIPAYLKTVIINFFAIISGSIIASLIAYIFLP